ncbi:MAG: phosphatase PAP2 family protein [Burkholderiales bacterium]|jgi:membrane-associated phospholipid phosphatase
MINALIFGREGIVDPTDGNAYGKPNGLPALTDPGTLERWEPWVRAYTVLGDLLSDIGFQTTATGVRLFDRRVTAATTIAAIERPAVATFQKQLPMVLSWAELRAERANEILAQIDPQYAFWSSILFIRPDRARWTMELINLTLQFCVYAEMRFKHAFGVWRPVELNPQVQPMISTPGHGSFPMGHATQAYAVAHVLSSLVGLGPSYGAGGATSAHQPTLFAQLQRQAARISTNRVIAGVHFPVDTMAGRMLGVALGEYVVARSGGAPGFTSRRFRAAGAIDAVPVTDFNPFDPAQQLDGSPPLPGATQALYSATAVTPPSQNTLRSPLLNHIWTKARAEWAGRFV